MKTCVINFGRGAWYPRGTARLVNSLKEVGFAGSVLTFDQESQIGAPTHQEAPYAFKPFAVEHARAAGYDLALWADSSCWAIKPIEPMFRHMEEHGHLFFYNCNTGNWSSDASLKSFGLTREEAFQVPMLMALCMGFNLRHPKTIEFLRRWKEKATDGVTFPGCWTNHNHEVSADPRVSGHRHDQTAASIIAHQLEMPLIVAHHTYFMYYETPTPPNVVMVAQGL